MSDVPGFPPSAADYVLTEDMFIPDIQKASDPKDRARRQRAVRKVVHAFNRAKISLSLWSLSMLWNYLRTTDWVCGERDVSKHPDGRLLLEQDASSRWPMAWYGRLFVIQATCHRTDELQRIHREHARHWGCAYHENRPFYPDIYPDSDRSSRSPGCSESSVAPSIGTQDSTYGSMELYRGRSPPRTKTESLCPTLADYDIIDPHHLEEPMPYPIVNLPKPPARTSPEVPRPAQADLVMPPVTNQPTQPTHTRPGVTLRPSHAELALPSFLLNQPEDPVPTGGEARNHNDLNQPLSRTSSLYMPDSCRANYSPRPACASPEIPRPAQTDPGKPPLSNQPKKPGHASPEASSRPVQIHQTTSPLLNQPEDPIRTGDGVINDDPVNHLLTIFPDLSLSTSRRANQPIRPARTDPKVPIPAPADPTIPPPRSQTADPARTGAGSESCSHPVQVHKAMPPPTLGTRLSHFLSTGEVIDPDGINWASLFMPGTRRTHQPTRPAHTGPEVPCPVQADRDMPPPSNQATDSARTSSEATPRAGHVDPALPLLNRPPGFPLTKGAIDPDEQKLRTLLPTTILPGSRHADQPTHACGPPSLVTNPYSLRACSPHLGDLPRIPAPNPKPADSVLDVQSSITQATQAAQQAIDLSQRALRHVWRLEGFSSNMSNYIQQSRHHAQQSRNYMDASTAATEGIEKDIRGSRANTEAAVATANRALNIVERLRQYLE